MNKPNIVTKHVIELPQDQWDVIFKFLKKILFKVEEINAGEPNEYLTAQEFMSRVKIKRWKFNRLREENRIKVIQRGSKLYVPASEVTKYFEEID